MAGAVRWVVLGVLLGVAMSAQAQVPDLMSAFQAGTKAMAMGGATSVTDTNTLSSLKNPATLALIDSPEYGLSIRNLPESNNVATGVFGNANLSGGNSRGRTTITHFGYAAPTKNGAFGISYSVGGFVDDHTTGVALAGVGNLITDYDRTIHGETNFLAASLGQLGPKYNVGYGLVIASQSARSATSFTIKDSTGTTTLGTFNEDLSGNQLGVGIIAGIQAVPIDQKTTWGASIRTPIRLSGSSTGHQVFSTVPGLFSFGAAQRQAARKGSDDFWIFAAQADYLFGGNGNDIVDRKNTLGYGLGAEYNLLRDNVRVPLRLGYRYVPASGSLFRDRSEVTAGVGYRPLGQDYGVDFSFARPTSGGGMDLALSVSYRPRKG